MELIVILSALLLISALSPFFGADTKTVELQNRRWGILRWRSRSPQQPTAAPDRSTPAAAHGSGRRGGPSDPV